jgi:pilus assembly protein CpaE
MRCVVASDHDLIGARVRDILLRQGQECQVGDLVFLDLAANRLAQARPDLLVVTMSPEPERALAAMREVKHLVRGAVLAVGAATEPKLILRALREGADQYLDETDLEAELEAALARLQGAAHEEADLGHLISLVGPSGGSGVSTLAVNLASVLAKEHKKCALIDLKGHSGDLAALLDLRPTHTLADLCVNGSLMDRSMLERSLVRHSSGVHLLAPPPPFADRSALTPRSIGQALTLARAAFPYVVTDLDPSFAEAQTLALRQSEAILLVFRLDFTSLRNAHQTLAHLEHLGIGAERVKLVANRYGQPKELPAAKVEEALGMKIFHYVPEDSKTVNWANNNGIPAVLGAPRARVCKSIYRLAAGVNGSRK